MREKIFSFISFYVTFRDFTTESRRVTSKIRVFKEMTGVKTFPSTSTTFTFSSD